MGPLVLSFSLNVVVLNSSYMYESDPMYFAEQPRFLNCVIKILTTKSPMKLLALLQQIEMDLGRPVKETRQENGPRY